MRVRELMRVPACTISCVSLSLCVCLCLCVCVCVCVCVQEPSLSIVDRLIAHHLSPSELSVLSALLGLFARLARRPAHTAMQQRASDSAVGAASDTPAAATAAAAGSDQEALLAAMDTLLLPPVGKGAAPEAPARRLVLCSLLLASTV